MSIISINGNIGSGKSTFVKLMKERCDPSKYIFVSEPVEIWQSIKDENGVDLLTNFYNNKEKYSFTFQMVAYISRLAILRKLVKENPDKIIVTERCMNTDKCVFLQMLYDQKIINKIEYEVYNKWFYEFLDDINIIKYAYLNVDPKLCHTRINKRNRNGENNISLDYLCLCDKYHVNWLQKENKVVILDGNIEFENDENIINKWINEII